MSYVFGEDMHIGKTEKLYMESFMFLQSYLEPVCVKLLDWGDPSSNPALTMEAQRVNSSQLF